MAVSIKKVKDILRIVKKLKKANPLDISKWNKEYSKVAYKASKEKYSPGGKYKTPDGKNFKGKYSLDSKLTKSKIPFKIKGKFSKKPSKLKSKASIRKNKRTTSSTTNASYVNPNRRVPKGEEGSGGGGGHEGPL